MIHNFAAPIFLLWMSNLTFACFMAYISDFSASWFVFFILLNLHQIPLAHFPHSPVSASENQPRNNHDETHQVHATLNNCAEV